MFAIKGVNLIPLTYTVELQWLDHLWGHDIMFEAGVVRGNEC